MWTRMKRRRQRCMREQGMMLVQQKLMRRTERKLRLRKE
jgi:hypothetical protein